MAEAWNIIDDFCEPVCAMLSFHGVLAGKSIKLLFPDGGLACVWLDVNVSTGVGDKVRGLLEAAVNGEPDAAEKAIRYIRRLVLVLRQRKGEEIPKETIPPDKLSKHYKPQDLKKAFVMSWDKLKKLLDTGAIPHIKHSCKDYQIHVDYLPEKRR